MAQRVSRAATVLAVTVLTLTFGACVAPRSTAPTGASEPTELRLKAGDRIRVVTKNRERMSLEIKEIRPAELVGVTLAPAPHETVPRGREVVLPYGDIAMIEVRRLSAARSVGLPALIVVVAAGMALDTRVAAAAAGT